MQQQGTMTPEQYKQTLQGLAAEINQLNAQIRTANQQMNSLPRFRGRLMTTYAQEQFAELLYFRTQLQAEVYEETAWLNQLRSQKFDPKSKEKIDAQVRDESETMHQAVLDLRNLVDSTAEKYAELAKDGEVKKALAQVGRTRGDKIKLGPSHDFQNNVKLLEKYERAVAGAPGDEPQAKPSRRHKSGTRSKRSIKSATGAGTPKDSSL
jgi:hypothetical protein